MDDYFRSIMDRTRLSEGGYVNDPADPGGETKFGISKRSYPELDIRNLTWEQAIEIYDNDFWTKTGIRTLPAPLAGSVFDFAVNSSPHTAISYLQRMLGIADDGVIGEVTTKAANDLVLNGTELRVFTAKYNANRLLFMTKLKNWNRNSAGWAIRVATRILEL